MNGKERTEQRERCIIWIIYDIALISIVPQIVDRVIMIDIFIGHWWTLHTIAPYHVFGDFPSPGDGMEEAIRNLVTRKHTANSNLIVRSFSVYTWNTSRQYDLILCGTLILEHTNWANIFEIDSHLFSFTNERNVSENVDKLKVWNEDQWVWHV